MSQPLPDHEESGQPRLAAVPDCPGRAGRRRRGTLPSQPDGGRRGVQPAGRELRDQAVVLVCDEHQSLGQVSRELGVPAGTLRDWVSEERRRSRRAGSTLAEDERAELARLREENRALGLRIADLQRSLALAAGDGASLPAIVSAAVPEAQGADPGPMCTAGDPPGSLLSPVRLPASARWSPERPATATRTPLATP